MRLDRHKDKAGVLVMLIIDTIPFVDNTAALPQSSEPHLEQQGISIAMPNCQQLHIHNIYIPPRSSCSAGHNASVAHLLCNNEMSLFVEDINAHHSRKKPAHRTVLVAIDLTAAFDNVDHQQLLDRVFNTNIPSTIRRWLFDYMQNIRA